MARFLAGLIVGIILFPAAAFLYIRFGYAPVATAAPPFPFERKLTSMALHARISAEAPRQPAVAATPDNLLAGARIYRKYCAGCHGMAGTEKSATAKGMYPAPPPLLHGKGVTDDPAGESFWKVKHGIRLTGMPAYGASLNDTELWQVSQFLTNANQLPAAVRAFLASPPPAK